MTTITLLFYKKMNKLKYKITYTLNSITRIFDNIRIKKNLIAIVIGCFSINSFATKNLITVKIGVLEAFSNIDSYASEHYKDSYQSALYYSLGKNDKVLAKCGYRFEIIKSYFGNTDLTSAKDAASKLNESDIWIVLGPQRSEKFLIASQKLSNTPMVSPIANSTSVTSLHNDFFSMYYPVNILAKNAVFAVDKERYGTSYGTFTDATCLECKDFTSSFNNYSKGKFNKQFGLFAVSDTPDLDELIDNISKHKIDFLLLPNYSKFSGYTISKLHTIFPNLKFVGSEGWGQNKWSFLPAYSIPRDTVGLSIRSGNNDIDSANLMQVYSLNHKWNNTILPPSYLAYAIIQLFNQLTTDICKVRPKNKIEFTRFLKQQSKTHFQTKLPMSIYHLKNNQTTFAYRVPNEK